jgi:hypothetical protein
MMSMNPATPYFERPIPTSIETNARAMLSLMLIAAACLFADLLIGMRGIDIGTDTYVYASFFESLRGGLPDTRFEPGFLLTTRLMSALGLSVNGYQMVLFAILLLTAFAATRRYFNYLGGGHGYLTFLSASLMLLFLSPMFVNASINAIRQGLHRLRPAGDRLPLFLHPVPRPRAIASAQSARATHRRRRHVHSVLQRTDHDRRALRDTVPLQLGDGLQPQRQLSLRRADRLCRVLDLLVRAAIHAGAIRAQTIQPAHQGQFGGLSGDAVAVFHPWLGQLFEPISVAGLSGDLPGRRRHHLP